MKTHELPESHKFYKVILSNKTEHTITGDQKRNLMDAEEKFIELGDGSIINKAFIVEIKFQSAWTKEMFSRLSEKDQKELSKPAHQQIFERLNEKSERVKNALDKTLDK